VTNVQFVKEGLNNSWCTRNMAGSTDANPDNVSATRLQMKLGIKCENTINLTRVVVSA